MHGLRLFLGDGRRGVERGYIHTYGLEPVQYKPKQKEDNLFSLELRK